MFRAKKGISVDYNRQGYIYFVSRNYDRLSKGQRDTIQQLCKKAGGENWKALFDFVTTDATATAVCMRHYIASPTTLHRMVRRYYEKFPRTI